MAATDGETDKRRPDPKALLELAAKEKRGKLKVFLGMAPGVGKTYAMLSAAHAQKAEGRDVVVGVIETHGRSETAALLDGLEVLARKPVTYQGHVLMEFDLAAALTRRPGLLLVDEFAHTNAPGGLHTKRFRDVEELLWSGVDVWTTLNIQHLESLTDVVERITGVTVRETVPDKVLLKADEIVVVDLTPADLIQRLREGKVYLPENARRAIDQFFKPANLTALRELALRHTADRVDVQMLEQLRQQGIEGPWPTAERLLVCVGGSELSETVVRTGARLAAGLKSDWVALHLKAADAQGPERNAKRRIDKALRLAERLGGKPVRLAGKDLVAEILGYAKRNNITQIVIGCTSAGPWSRLRRRTLPDQILAAAKGFAVTIVTPASEKSEALAWQWPVPHVALTGTGAAVGAVALAVAAGHWLEKHVALPNLSMIFLLAVMSCALSFGVWSALIASALSFLAYNFFFIDPRYTFTVAEPHELFALMIFLAVAAVTGWMAGRLKEQSQAIGERAVATQSLYEFARTLAGAAKLDHVLWLLASQLAALAKGTSIILMKRGDELRIEGGWPPEDTLSTSDWAAARWAFEHKEPAGRGTATMPTARFQFRNMESTKGPIGVVGIAPDEAAQELSIASEAVQQALIDQAALAVERTMLVEEAAQAETARENEKLRAALLSSLSHDLRTPLSSIIGSVTSLRGFGDKLAADDRADLLATIEEEAGRLSRFVSNLLDMTRLESGAVKLRSDPVDVADLARDVCARAAHTLPKLKIELRIAEALPLVSGDATLLGQVMFNLLDNAQKYSETCSHTEVAAARCGENVRITVTDQGIGIPRDSLEKVFEKFYRVEGSDGRAAGTGLGLSICAAIVKAMNGTIRAESPVRNGKGTRIIIELPIAEASTAPIQSVK